MSGFLQPVVSPIGLPDPEPDGDGAPVTDSTYENGT